MNYTGIGARKTPKKFIRNIKNIAKYLGNTGFTLRSGGANGADLAFENGCDSVEGKKEIFLPWKDFNNNKSSYYSVGTEARKVASEFHPNWNKLTEASKKFMGRNVYQVLGMNHDDPTDFIICWTPEGHITGGTGQALRMAEHYKIPVFNFGSQSLKDMETEMLLLIRKLKNGH